MANAHQTYHSANNSEFIKAAKISNRLGTDPNATQGNFNSRGGLVVAESDDPNDRSRQQRLNTSGNNGSNIQFY